MTHSTNQKPKNFWKILFGISLTLNLLVVGAVGGVMIRMDKGPMINHIAPGTLYMRALDFQDRRTLRQKILQNKDVNKLDKAGSKVSLRSAVGILRSQPFDRSTFENLLDKQKQYTNSTQSSARTTLITHIENMTEEERLAYAQRLEDLIH